MFFKSKVSGASWLLVFLGNPGSKYDNTRHNVGFQLANAIEKDKQIKIARSRFNALTAICEFGEEKALLIKPQTFMNLSGNAVAPAAAFYKIPSNHIIVICDDMSLPAGKLRIRGKGSSGGHNGLKSIISALGTQEFPRIKIGVGVPEKGDEDAIVNWVLGKPCQNDAKEIENALDRAYKAIDAIINKGIDRAMNLYN